MKKAAVELRLGRPGYAEKEFREEGQRLLTVTAKWPRLEGTAPGLKRVDRYYDALAARWLQRWEGSLAEQAKAARPERPWSASLDFTVTLFRDGLLSLYLDAVEDVGQRRPRRVRQGDVWALPSGAPLTLRELLPRRRRWRGAVLEEVRRQIGERVQSGESAFYEDWPALAAKRFSPRRFYLTEGGAVVFYPVESIAPAMEGFPAFPLGGLYPLDKAAPPAAADF